MILFLIMNVAMIVFANASTMTLVPPAGGRVNYWGISRSLFDL